MLVVNLDTPYQTVIEASRDWGKAISDVIQAAGNGQFPLFVMADRWCVEKFSSSTIDGWVRLNETDIRKAIVQDHIVIKRVSQDGRWLALEEPKPIMFGAVFVEREIPEVQKELSGKTEAKNLSQDEFLLTTRQAANYLSLASNTLDKHRMNGTGPDFTKVGSRTIRYTKEALDDWKRHV